MCKQLQLFFGCSEQFFRGIEIKSKSILHSKKNESCVTQDKTVYRAKAKFILTRIEQFEINTVYCVELFLNGTK